MNKETPVLQKDPPTPKENRIKYARRYPDVEFGAFCVSLVFLH